MKKFKDLTPEERSEIVEYLCEHGEIEFYSKLNNRWTVVCFALSLGDIYRIPQTKSSINWDHVHPDFNVLTRDRNKECTLFERTPFSRGTIWGNRKGKFADAEGFASLKIGNCPWDEDITYRPGYEP